MGYSRDEDDFYENLNADSLFLTTGFLMLEDADYSYWYYCKRRGMLVPYMQEPPLQPYAAGGPGSGSDRIKLNADWYPCEFPEKEDAIDFFTGLSKISAFKECQIERRIWMLSDYDFVYNGYTKSIIPRDSIRDQEDRIFALQCVYLAHPDADEENNDWRKECICWSRLNLCPAAMETEFRKVIKQIPAEEEHFVPTVKKEPSQPSKPAEPVKIKSKITPEYTARLLDCDKRRCRLDSYGENILYDFKCGHWDLFDEIKGREHSRHKMIPRDPRQDIKKRVVGIDFGTKSTVIVCQSDTSSIVPVHIGPDIPDVEKNAGLYENPTAIACINLNQFLKKYQEKPGRPDTDYGDFFTSHDAWNDYQSCPLDEFYTYYTELKQWADCQPPDLSVMDRQGQEYLLGTDMSEEAHRINPIELYAYYIGMYLNNMRNGIHLQYLMSFPAEYSKETRQLITDSFEKGIRKSLPSCLLEDEVCMKDFYVRQGVSEPVAYAVTALETSCPDPKDENETYMYGVFDFGGGTTDFAFGLWRGASEWEYETEGYDYVLECFETGSDSTLGGERILELLACDVFDSNRELVREKKLAPVSPTDGQPFPGGGTFLSHSRAARKNMFLLKEGLRPLWHQEDNWKEKYCHKTDDENTEEYLELSLYDNNEKLQPDCRFSIDTDHLISLIKARIQKGILAFFRCMEKMFLIEENARRQTGNIHIFLAGNAGRSVFVEDLFQETIYSYYEAFRAIDENAGTSYFTLVRPLNAENEDGTSPAPGAKTGVAYGLIKSREGSSIKIVKSRETDVDRQADFKYYLGREKRHCFDCRLSPVETEYGSWVRFQGASRPIIRIYYTTDPMADARSEPLKIDGIRYKEVSIEPEQDAFLFIRACRPTVIEYAVSPSEEMIDDDTCEIGKIDFDT